uniref:Tumor necrosis factor receptor superfamily, member 1a n=1 Tax=Scleropages formosus TaxID=113540 RepID=A0A8C9W2P1_SCLFO
MDRYREGRRKAWINVGLSLLIFWALCVHTHASPQRADANRTIDQPETCRTDEYRSRKGHCCNKCFPGFKLVKECEHKDHRSTCEECPKDEFMENSNKFEKCFRCKICKSENYEKELFPCTTKQNRECGCVDGYFKRKISIETSQCIKCRICGDGMVELRKCMPDSDTECKCKDDHYQHYNGDCRPCKICGDGENCKEHCNRTIQMPTQKPHPGDFKMPLIVLAVIFPACGAGIFALVYILYKRNPRSKMTSGIPESPSSSTTESLMSSDHQDLKSCFRQECSPSFGKDEVFTLQGALPDCVPHEFNSECTCSASITWRPRQREHRNCC